MQSKSLLVAIAAFAVTATSVQAYGGTDILEKAGLTKDQISAFESARAKRQSGDFVGARDTLMQAGVDEQVLHSVHEASKEARDAIKAAVKNHDFAAFTAAATRTPLAGIDTEDKFNRFIEAEQLKDAGKWNEAKTILDNLGIKQPMHGIEHGMHIGQEKKGHRGMKMDQEFQNLTTTQRDALRVAHQSNDKETERAILEEAGITLPGHHFEHR